MKNSQPEWPVRPWLLSALLGLVGLGVYWITEGLDSGETRLSAPQQASAVFLTVFGVVLAYSLERTRSIWSLVFALFWGGTMGGIAYWAAGLHEYGSLRSWPFVSGLFSVAIAVPIFQTARDQGRATLPYSTLHSYAWSDAVSWFAAWLFVGISFLLLNLLAALFDLIGIRLLEDLLRETWFRLIFIGLSFGAALGVLRENQRILQNLQGLVMTVLSLLAPVLAFALALFLISLPFTGLQSLWAATKNTTPILLTCAAGALLLSNAIIRALPGEQSRNRVLMFSALSLAGVVLPLAVIAWVSMQQRVHQYGITPDRLWAMLCISVATIYGACYLFSLAVGRHQWPTEVRKWNTRVAIFLCGLALILALPIVDFGRWSADHQFARLQDGRTEPLEIDLAAFAYDFGPAGREYLRQFAKSEDETLSNGAQFALNSENRWQLREQLERLRSENQTIVQLQVFPEPTAIPPKLMKVVHGLSACLSGFCALYWPQDSEFAHLIDAGCLPSISPADMSENCTPRVIQIKNTETGWQAQSPAYWWYESVRNPTDDRQQAQQAELAEAIKRGEVNVRTVEKQQLFIGDTAVGQPFD